MTTTVTLPNTQEPEKVDHRPDGHLDVHSIWYTIQGEGPFTGCPASFVRLTGCNLQCPGCDTEYTSVRDLIPPIEILRRVEETRAPKRADGNWVKHPNLIVLTGGEPFRQNIVPFIKFAHAIGWHVQIETNGTLWVEGFETIGISSSMPTVVCSPKTGRIHPKLQPYITALKYVGRATEFLSDGLPSKVLGLRGPVIRPWPEFRGEVYLQPMDEQDKGKNAANTGMVVASCMKFGYRLGLQIHKDVGLD